MEILIPGLVLVGFMVWASTRIKRNAARAFDRERIETPDYTLVKPEGFLAPVDPADGTLFSAYSKDFGRGENEKFRQATLELRRYDDTAADELIDRITADAAEIAEQQTGIIDGRKCATIVAERAEDGVALESHYRLVSAPDAVYQLTANILPEHKDDLQQRIDEYLNSFSLA